MLNTNEYKKVHYLQKWQNFNKNLKNIEKCNNTVNLFVTLNSVIRNINMAEYKNNKYFFIY